MYNRIYQFMKNTNYIIFLIVYIILSGIISLLGDTLFLLPDLSSNMWEIKARFIIGLPLLLQLLVTHIAYRKNRSNGIITILMVVTVLYTIICASLALYDLYFTIPNFGDDLTIRVFFAQLLFQILLIVALITCMLFKVVYKKVILKSIIIFIINLALVIVINFFIVNELFIVSLGMVYLILSICSYNPVMLFTLISIAKGKLFIKERYSQ